MDKITGSINVTLESTKCEAYGTVEKLKEALENCEDLPDTVINSFSEKPDDFFQMMIDKAPDGLDIFKTILDPEMIETAKITLEVVLTILG